MPRRGGHLRAALSGGDRGDSWDTLGGRFQQAAASTLFEGLTEIAADGTLRGALALSWSSDTEARDWQFELRETAFHDELPLVAADLVAALSGLAAVELTGQMLRLQLPHADPNLPYRLAHPDYLIKPADDARRAAGIGTGPYRLRKYDAGRHFIADRVETHWKDGQAAWFDTVEFVHFDDDSIRAEALRDALVDVADIAEVDAFTDPQDFQRLPDAGQVTEIAHRKIAVPLQVGRAFPLDNLRMAERWWMA